MEPMTSPKKGYHPSETPTDVKTNPTPFNHPLTTSPTKIPGDFAIKHPLQFAWSWWYDNPGGKNWKSTQQSWGDHLKKIYTFHTVEDFWCLWNNIKGANELPSGSNYHVFKDGIEPKWEDSANKCGGKWLIQLKTAQRNSQLNQLWLWAVLACIGNSFEDEEDICGVVVSVRKSNDKICLWTRDATQEEKTMRIGKQLKELLGLQIKLEYQVHVDAIRYNSSFNNKPKFEV